MKIPSASERSKFNARMKPQTSPKGVHVLPDILDRCTVDDETGCWVWRHGCSDAAENQRSAIPALWSPTERRVTSAARLAWLLAGFPLEARQVVFRHRCFNSLCVHPLHAAAGTQSELNGHRAAAGLLKADAAKCAFLDRIRVAVTLPREKVAAVEAHLAAGATPTQAAREHEICFDTAKRIADGLHPFSAGRAPAARGSSVFAGALA